MNMLYHTHISSWAILVLLFFISYFLIKSGKEKGGKIAHMILRLFFVIMVVSGIGMLINYSYPMAYHLKAGLAIILIGAMEMLLTRTQKGTIGSKAPLYWGVVIVLLILVILIGFGVISF